MFISTSAKRFFVSLILIGFICFCATSAFAEKKEPNYQTATYFEARYSAYAYAQVSGDEIICDVYLQFMPNFSSSAVIEAYTIYVDDEALTTEMKPVQSASDKGRPTHFSASAEVERDIKKIALLPYTATSRLEKEEIILYDAEATADTTEQTAVVSNPVATDKLNLRIAPDGNADSLRQYYNGVQVEVLNTMPNNWVAVSIGQSGGVARGYMKADYLVFGKEGDAVEVATPSYKAIVESWTLYSYADEGSLSVGEFGKGQAFTILARSSAWWHIAVGDSTGFVRADVLVQPDPPIEETPVTVTAPISISTQEPQETAPSDAALEPRDTPAPTDVPTTDS